MIYLVTLIQDNTKHGDYSLMHGFDQDGSGHAALMDRVYRYQRHIYDATRKYILPGRDVLLNDMDIKPGHHVLEIGCGTCRNLIILAGKHKESEFYGLDVSREMLGIAENKIRAQGMDGRIIVVQGLAEDLDPVKMFDRPGLFDVIFFSYSLTMIRDWRTALGKAVHSLTPAGKLYIIDFGDPEKQPVWLRGMLKTWLGIFHVHHDPGVVQFLRELAQNNGRDITIESFYRNYAFKAVVDTRGA